MEKENMFTKTEIFTKEILSIIKNTESEDLYTKRKKKRDHQFQKENTKVSCLK